MVEEYGTLNQRDPRKIQSRTAVVDSLLCLPVPHGEGNTPCGTVLDSHMHPLLAESEETVLDNHMHRLVSVEKPDTALDIHPLLVGEAVVAVQIQTLVMDSLTAVRKKALRW